MTENINLKVGDKDVAIVIHPENESGDKYSFNLSIPNEIQESIDSEDCKIPPYVLLAFQICQYITDGENLAKMNEFFETSINETKEKMEADDGIVD